MLGSSTVLSLVDGEQSLGTRRFGDHVLKIIKQLISSIWLWLLASENVFEIPLSGYFRQEQQQRIQWRGLCLEGSRGSRSATDIP